MEPKPTLAELGHVDRSVHWDSVREFMCRRCGRWHVNHVWKPTEPSIDYVHRETIADGYKPYSYLLELKERSEKQENESLEREHSREKERLLQKKKEAEKQRKETEEETKRELENNQTKKQFQIDRRRK